MSANLLGWIFGVGAAQGAFLVIALANLTVRNSTARWLLAAILLILTLTLAEEFLDVIDYPLGPGTGLVAEFALWPLLYLFVASLAEDDPRPIRSQWRHFVPLAVALVWYLIVYFGSDDRWISLSNPDTRQFVAATVLVKALYFAVYAALILRRPLALSAKPNASRRALRWVRRWLWVICTAYLVTLASFLAFYLELYWAVDSDYVGGLIMVLAIYSLGYFALANRNVFDVRRRRPDRTEAAPDSENPAQRARRYLQQSRAFLDPELGLRRLADALQVNETRLSQELNHSVDGGFYTLVNDMRLDACLALFDDPANERRTVLELAYEAGFSSKATFYRYFRARTGTTPRAYRASAG